MNPVQSVFCTECGGHLLSSTDKSPGGEAAPTIKGLSLPTKGTGEQPEPRAPDSEAMEEDVPAWLRELSAARASEEHEAREQREDEGDIPDWLKDLRASLPSEEEAAVPSPAEEPDAPDWLASLRPVAGPPSPADLPSSQEEEQEEKEEEELPHWLKGIRPPADAETAGPAAARRAEEEAIPDWLAELHGPAEEEAFQPAEMEDEETLPDWLAELRSAGGPPAAAPKVPAQPEEVEEDVPAWLAELQSPGPPEATGAAAPPEPKEVEEDIPAWLAELQSAGETGEVGQAPAKAEVGALPDWLTEPGIEAGEKEARKAQPDADEKALPDWLADVQPPVATAEAAEAPPEADEKAIPGWLEELRPQMEAETPGDEEAAIPDWLAALRPSTVESSTLAGVPDVAAGKQAGSEEVSGPTSPPSAAESEILDWLADMQAQAPLEEEGQEEAAIPDWLVQVPPGEEGAETEDITAGEMPDWLQMADTAEPEAPVGTGTPQEPGGDLPPWLVPSARDVEEEESLAPAEIPHWLLALKPAELWEEDEQETPLPLIIEPGEETGLLAGLRGTLPVEMVIAQPRAVAAGEPPQVIQGDTAQARLFAQVVGRGPEAMPRALPQPRQSVMARLPLWITYLALLAAVTLPLLLQNSPFERIVEPPAAVLDLYETLEVLDPGRPVLVVFDYDPSSSDEMNVLARAVVGHLLDREVPVVAVSLLSAGPPVAESLLGALAADRPGSRYVNAGYLSGQAAAIQLLAQGLESALLGNFQRLAPPDLEVVGEITGFESFGLLLVLTADPEGLRVWIEQAGALQGAPVAAAVSASTEPMARPYYETDPRQLRGLVAGVPGAAVYEALRREDGRLTAEMAARLDSHLAGHAVLVLVLVVGNFAYLVRRGPRGRR
jgi:hypothetical protein